MAHRRTSAFTRRRLLQTAAGGVAAASLPAFLLDPELAEAADPCTPNPVWAENLMAGSGAYQVAASANPMGTDPGAYGAFATRTSFDLGEDVTFRLVSFGGPTTVTADLYRLGYYGGSGGRRVFHATGVALDTVNSGFLTTAPGGTDDLATLGYRRTKPAAPQLTIPGAEIPASGVYLLKLTRSDNTQNQAVVIVRDDNRDCDLRVVMPTNSWQAYNNEFGYSMYFGTSYGLAPTVSGQGPLNGTDGRYRGIRLSFDRKHANWAAEPNWPMHTEFPLIFWLERMGYDVAYADDHWLDDAPLVQRTAPRTKAIVIGGHSEYWTQAMRTNVEEARDAGTHLASFSANTTYWRVRYEDNRRTMVCFKTIEGTFTQPPDPGRKGVNDFGAGQAALGPASTVGTDLTAGTADDHAAVATTTYRDPGAGPTDVAADGFDAPDDTTRGHGRVGIHNPESRLWGVMYIGDTDNEQTPLQVPAADVTRPGEFADHSIWRHTPVAGANSPQPIPSVAGDQYVGWEFDAIPTGTDPVNHLYRRLEASNTLPAGLKVVAATPLPHGLPFPRSEFLHDGGRRRTNEPPDVQPGVCQAVTYRAPSGALVFASGTMRWSLGLAPHFPSTLSGHDFSDPRIDGSNPVMQQATYNLFSDMGIEPTTPVGVTQNAPPKSQDCAPPATTGTTGTTGTSGTSGTGGTTGTPSTSGTTGTTKPCCDDTRPPTFTISGRTVHLTAAGRARIVLAMPAREPGVATGRLTLRSAVAIRTDPRSRRTRKVTFGSAAFKLTPGKHVTVEVKLSRANRALIARLRSVQVVATVTAQDAAKNKRTRSRTFPLRPPLTVIPKRTS